MNQTRSDKSADKSSDNKFSRGVLRSFDKSTGGFLDKEFTAEYSVTKTSHFFKVGIRDDMSVSDKSVSIGGSTAVRTLPPKPVSLLEPKQASRIERLFNNPYLDYVLSGNRIK
jgi:hypothetical protein